MGASMENVISVVPVACGSAFCPSASDAKAEATWTMPNTAPNPESSVAENTIHFLLPPILILVSFGARKFLSLLSRCCLLLVVSIDRPLGLLRATCCLLVCVDLDFG